MKIIRTCPFTGILNSIELDCEPQDMYDWQNKVKTLIECTPNLSDLEREYIQTGIIPEEVPRYG
jgi:hypothetical protein